MKFDIWNTVFSMGVYFVRFFQMVDCGLVNCCSRDRCPRNNLNYKIWRGKKD